MKYLMFVVMISLTGCVATQSTVLQSPKQKQKDVIVVFDSKFQRSNAVYYNDKIIVDYYGDVYFANSSKRNIYDVRAQATLFADGYKKPLALSIINYEGPYVMAPQEANHWRFKKQVELPLDFEGDVRIHTNFWFNEN